MPNLISLTAIPIIILIAWAISEDRKALNFKHIAIGLSLQFLIAGLIFFVLPAFHLLNGYSILDAIRDFTIKLMSFSDKGSEFVFGKGFMEHFFAFSVLPSIIFFSAIMAILFHIGIMQSVIRFFARILKTMDISGAEAIVTAGNMFVGQIEAPLMVRPCIEKMTRSELMVLMITGMSTTAMALIPVYTAMGMDSVHLIASTFMSAPAALLIAKIIVPEKEISLTKVDIKIDVPKESYNIFEAACNGALTGLQIAVSIAAVIIAYVAIIHLLDWTFSVFPDFYGAPLTMERIIGWCYKPVAFLIGVEWKDAQTVGMIMGKAVILNEFIAYMELGAVKGALSERSFILATYAICSFANFTSIGIQIAGIGKLAETRKKEVAGLGLKVLAGSILASLMTAAIAGIFI